MAQAKSESPMRHPTVREVAALAGVSPMTVSRTLDGGKNVRPEMQSRVHEAVRQLDYYRNENARSLRGQRSGLIGVAITNLGNPYYGNFALGVEEIATQHGRRILLGNTDEDPIREQQLVADFVGRQVEGLIVVPCGGDTNHLEQDVLRGTPLVLASRTADGLQADTVLLDDVGGAYRGTKVLLERGHRRIGYLGNVTSVFTEQRRFEGFERALSEFGLTPDPELLKRGQQDVETARHAMATLLDLTDPPTAIFSANNRNTIGALKEIGSRLDDASRKSVLPSIVSFDNFELAEMMPVPVIIVDHDARELGRVAAGMLFERLIGSRPPGVVRRIEMPTPVWVARA